MPTLASGELSKSEKQQKVGVKSTSVPSRDMTTPPVLGGMRIDPRWNGAKLTQEQRIVPVGTAVQQEFGTAEGAVKSIDKFNSLQETWKADASGFGVVTPIQRWNPDIRVREFVTQSIVPVGALHTFDQYDLEMEEGYIDAVHKIRRVTTIAGVPPSFDSYSTQRITFPGILFYLNFALIQLAGE
jgi:hypothetical protein